MDKQRLFRTLFFILLVMELIGHGFDLDTQYLSKPLLMPSLILYFISSIQERKAVFWLILAALVLSWAGDVLLIFQYQHPLFFMLGLASFLVAHLVYIYAYSKAKWEKPIKPLLTSQKLRHALTLSLAGMALIYILLPGLGNMKIPVIIYAAVLVVMAIVAMLRYGYTNISSFGYVFGGAILFMISDSLLAINKFLDPITLAGVWVMLTYCLAQYFIVEGIKKHYSKN
ncbi:MAG TPA: lysoplasmalogenase [Fulvivirga sp.]|nr:lysoplasmalogenase [Fulvivirga sp.]